MSHTEGKLFVMDLREFGEEQLSISNGQIERGIICRIKNEVRKAPIDDEDLANARRLVACWNACEGIPVEQLECDQSTFVQMLLERQTLKQERDEMHAVLLSAYNFLQGIGWPES